MWRRCASSPSCDSRSCTAVMRPIRAASAAPTPLMAWRLSAFRKMCETVKRFSRQRVGDAVFEIGGPRNLGARIVFRRHEIPVHVFLLELGEDAIALRRIRLGAADVGPALPGEAHVEHE